MCDSMKKVILKKNSFQSGMSSSSSPLFSSSSPLNGNIWRPYSNEDNLPQDHFTFNTLDNQPINDPQERNCAVDIPLDFSNCKKLKVDDSNHVDSLRSVINGARNLDNNKMLIIPISPEIRSSKVGAPTINPDINSEDLVRNSPQNECNFSLSNRDTLRNLQPQQTDKVTSKIDLMEMKLKAKRLALFSNNNSVSIDDYDISDSAMSLSDYENNSDEESLRENIPSKLKAKLIITKGPPLKLDTSREKLNFMKSLELITHRDKQDLEYKRFCREYERRRQKRLADETSTVLPENASNHLLPSSNDQVSLEPSHILPSSINVSRTNGKVENIDEKIKFMSTLGLELESNTEKIKERELEWEGILSERERRKSLNMCFSKLLNNLSKETLAEWFEFLSHSYKITKNGYTDANPESRFASQTTTPHKRLIDYPRTSQKSREFDKSNLSKDYSSKSHLENLVIVSEERQSKSSPHANCVKSPPSNNSNIDFKWPGVEAIIESYRRYSIGMIYVLIQITFLN